MSQYCRDSPTVCVNISADVLNEKRKSQKDLIPFICVVFLNVVLSWKNALALPAQSSGVKRFLFSVKWNRVKSV